MNELSFEPVRLQNLTSRPVYVARLDSRAYGRDCRELCFQNRFVQLPGLWTRLTEVQHPGHIAGVTRLHTTHIY